MRKKRRSKNNNRRSQNHPSWWQQVIQKFRLLLFFGMISFGLFLLLLGSIWVAGPHLFVLDGYRNSLFISSKIDEQNKSMYLAYFFPSTQEITVIKLQSEEVNVLGNYGEYELEQVQSLLKMEKKSPHFQQAALSWGTQAIVDQIADISSQTDISTKKELQTALWREVRSHWSQPSELSEYLKLFFFTRSVPSEQIEFKLEPTPPSKLDMLDNVVLYEGCLVAVVNTTEKVGMASKFSNLLEKNGVVVIRITDQRTPYELSTIAFNSGKPACVALSKRLQVLFPEEIQTQENKEIQDEYRADLVILLGNDLADSF